MPKFRRVVFTMATRGGAARWLGVVAALSGGCRERDPVSTLPPAPTAVSASPAASPSGAAPPPSPTTRRDGAPDPTAPPAPGRNDGPSPMDGGRPPKPFDGTAGIVEERRDGSKPALLRDVRTGRHDGYDRVVFEFAAAPLPGYHLEYIDKPVRKCGSGDPTALAGDGWLEIRFTPADAHTPKGEPTVRDRERTLTLGVMRELELTCDFEATTTWVVGVSSPNRYRVVELADPPRIAVDILH